MIDICNFLITSAIHCIHNIADHLDYINITIIIIIIHLIIITTTKEFQILNFMH